MDDGSSDLAYSSGNWHELNDGQFFLRHKVCESEWNERGSECLDDYLVASAPGGSLV
ncbi:hypothetical protein KIPB_014163, partial [Kipferlia bialata]|eukprot:g14163.t1